MSITDTEAVYAYIYLQHKSGSYDSDKFVLTRIINPVSVLLKNMNVFIQHIFSI